MTIRAVAISLGLVAFSAGMAMAADPVVYSPSTPGVVTSSSSFDWDGFYLGVGGVYGAYSTPTNIGELHGIAGINVTSGDFLFGGEIYGGYARNSSAANSGVVGGEVRAGFLASPDALIYAAAGADYYTNGATLLGTVGGGVEFAATDNLSLDVEYKYKYNATITGHQIGVSALWHFN